MTISYKKMYLLIFLFCSMSSEILLANEYMPFIKEKSFQELNHESIIRKGHCLSGLFNNYKDWRKELVALGRVTDKEFEKRLTEKEYDYYKSSVNCASIIYKVQNYYVRGFVLYPKEQRLSRLPAIVFNRGGSDLHRHTIKVGDLFLLPYQLAAAGNVVIASQYGGAQVWPEDREFDIGVDEFGGQELQDVLALVSILKSMPMVDIEKLGMVGWSRGSMMSMLALKNGEKIKSMVIGGSLVDLSATVKERPEFEQQVLKRLIPMYANNKDKELFNRSAINWYKELPSIPLLMLHGEDDQYVNPEHARLFHSLFSEQNKQAKYIEYPNGSHTLIEQSDKVQREIINWFANTL
ncbi:alpha/beta hydrolase family protein [Pseudoalteromonas sp. T1lg76]|uniref:alpha/beta hydrolase family protein n=1 Tax=Pseudoalteromonas sp. T1lg76 TaxID=2077103 RepID=UPI000CF60B07|nr:prolyl oligopeptidase family serine peptidase [Pseudoalteromonas sp. T1lg76]